jgi:hypothetical protein
MERIFSGALIKVVSEITSDNKDVWFEVAANKIESGAHTFDGSVDQPRGNVEI